MKIELRKYRPQKKTQKIIDIVLKLVEKYDIALTVRQVHYLLVEIPEAEHLNTQSAYQKVSRILTDMRYGGLLDWDKIVDETRSVYKTTSYEDIDEAMKLLLKRYRRDRWKDSKYYIEVWVEKRTLVNQFCQITNKHDVFLASGGGFSSTTYVYEAFQRLEEQQAQGKKIIIFYFGDLDPSGDFMGEDIKKRFEEWDLNLDVRRICLNNDQVKKYKLKKRFDVPKEYRTGIENKIKKDPRAESFYEKHGELFQVELEALDPGILNKMLEKCLLKYVNLAQHESVKETEEEEVELVTEKLWGDDDGNS